MTSVSYPGVYVEEVPGGARPIEVASTSTAAFVGIARRGPDGSVIKDEPRARRVTSWQEFQKLYGGFVADGYLAESVYQFFNNGGRQCYIVRVIGSGARAASITVPNRAGTQGMKFSARSSGAWGNSLYINIEPGDATDPGNTFNLLVYQQDDPNAKPTREAALTSVPVEVHENLVMDSTSKDYFAKRINEDSAFLFVELDTRNTATIRGFHQGGLNPARSIAADLTMDIDVDGDGVQKITLAAGAALADIASDIQAKVRALTPLKNSTHATGFTSFTCAVTEEDIATELSSPTVGVQITAVGTAAHVVRTGTDPFVLTHGGNATADIAATANAAAVRSALTALSGAPIFTVSGAGTAADPWIVQRRAERLVLTSGRAGASSGVVVRPSSQNDATALLQLGPGRGVSFGGLSNRRPAIPAPSELYQVGDHPASGIISSELGVDDTGSITVPTSFENAFSHLNNISDVSLLAVPGQPGMFDSGVAYCENRQLRDIFFIGETADTDDEPHEAEAARTGINKPNTYGALYFPWIKSPDLTGGKEPVLLPPSGFVAGLMARIDSTRGVWKAPAGTEASVSGAAGLLRELTDIEQGNLNRIGVNCLRRFPLAGIVSWGARTVSSDPEYKYVPVRRTAIMLRRSINDGIQWAVFEPNDHRLWASLRLNIAAFMNGLFRAGAFQGEKANDAYYVRCGLGDTMDQGDIDRGQVIVEIGFAALKPAEFVIVRIQQRAGQTQ